MAAPSGATPVLGLRYPTQDDDVDVPRDIKALAEDTEAKLAPYIGEIRMFGFPNPMPRWLACDATVKEQAAYPELFAKIGTTWNTGGETPTQFRLPPFAGRALVGAGAGAGLTARVVATRWGVEAVVLTAAQSGTNGNGQTGGENTDHVHYLSSNPLSDVGTHWAYASAGGVASICIQNPGTGGRNTGHIHTLGARAADASHDNTQPSIAVPVHIYAGRV